MLNNDLLTPGTKAYVQQPIQTVAEVLHENTLLRRSVQDKDDLINIYAKELHSKELTIQELQGKLRKYEATDPSFSLNSSRSTFFNPTDGAPGLRKSESLGDNLFSARLSLDRFSLEEKYQGLGSGSADWKSDTASNQAVSSVETNALKQIWNPPQLTTASLTKSRSNISLSTTIEGPDPSYPTSNSSQMFGETKELKTTFKGFVEKIVKTNDQPCSIFLQQRLRAENAEVRALIFDAVMVHVLSLMKNRFGNFLVQCCLECASEEQAQMLCQKMKGHVVQLSCDRFGCHVMQKVIINVDVGNRKSWRTSKIAVNIGIV
jgi:hypothetical protein